MTDTSRPEIIEGMCRNDQDTVRSHLYAKIDGDLWPMCGYGWNRSGGHRFSIFRGHHSARGTCKLCQRNVTAGKPPVMDGWDHRTRWL